ncbi:MAG: thymidine phosphorylase [Acidobacteria bacterium]|nr:MAG: thymidine phosphorylase [Acidobacteriota bacterium]
MNAVDLITRKREGRELSASEIAYLIDGCTQGKIPDYQISALLMAIFFRGMNSREILALTESMVHSGQVVDLGHLSGLKVDKHSTGGVGDKTSLVVAPLVAAAGAYVPMISGRGLGFSGGTLDKLESIPGFNVRLSLSQFKGVLQNCGCAFIGQTEEIAPADRRLYALRDVTATVESIPLICASIMSKKVAEGIDGLVLDVKVGEGAFMRSLEEASDLAQSLVDIGNGMGTKTVAFISDMNQPLGLAVGNSLEVVEAIETLKGQGPEDLTHLCEKLAIKMLALASPPEKAGRAKEKIAHLLRSGEGLEKFRQIIQAQGGDPAVIDNYSRLPQASHRRDVLTQRSGYVVALNARKIGEASMALGAGREKVDSQIDYSVGILLRKKIGDFVEKDEPLATVHFNSESKFEEVQATVLNAFVVGPARVDPPSLIKSLVETSR